MTARHVLSWREFVVDDRQGSEFVVRAVEPGLLREASVSFFGLISLGDQHHVHHFAFTETVARKLIPSWSRRD
jgi:hypothetical protein